MSTTKIEYLDRTWNPIKMRCTRVSSGCANCWHLRMADRMMANPKMPEEARQSYHGFKPVLDEKELEAPLHWRKPQRVGVQFMGDLFHVHVPPSWRDKVFSRMALCPQHTFAVLTKRPNMMKTYLSDSNTPGRIMEEAFEVNFDDETYAVDTICDKVGLMAGEETTLRWPIPNIWLGVSVEDQETADERIPLLMQTPAAVRWISAEPLLGPIDFRNIRLPNSGGIRYDVINTQSPDNMNWVVVGGESGPKARPCDVEWIRSIVGQCRSAWVPVFKKQRGSNPYDSKMPCVLLRDTVLTGNTLKLKDRSGSAPSEWPADLRVREMPE